MIWGDEPEDTSDHEPGCGCTQCKAERERNRADVVAVAKQRVQEMQHKQSFVWDGQIIRYDDRELDDYDD